MIGAARMPEMPESLTAIGPYGLAYWQWIGAALLILASWILGRLVARIVIWGLRGVSRRTETTIDDELIGSLRRPLRLLASIGLARVAVPLLELPRDAHVLALDVLLPGFAIALVWGALRTIDVVTNNLGRAQWAIERPSSRSLLSLVGRAAKVVVVVIAGIGFLSAMGLPVASLLAGLGIGGIALAFGAQKTVENLFGAFALGVDQPFREGDFVRIDADVLGTVEAVGLRSTRVRTLDRTVVSLPNGRLADMRIETFAARDRCRFSAMFGVVYETTAQQLRDVLAGFERVLREHPGIWPNDVVVRFVSFGESSLDIEVMAWFKTGDYGQFRTWRQDALLGFMDVIEQVGTSFAFPTRTLHLVGPEPVAAAGTLPAPPRP